MAVNGAICVPWQGVRLISYKIERQLQDDNYLKTSRLKQGIIYSIPNLPKYFFAVTLYQELSSSARSIIFWAILVQEILSSDTYKSIFFLLKILQIRWYRHSLKRPKLCSKSVLSTFILCNLHNISLRLLLSTSWQKKKMDKSLPVSKQRPEITKAGGTEVDCTAIATSYLLPF